jgi:hypothetical protein
MGLVGVPIATFGDHVRYVVRIGSQEQMTVWVSHGRLGLAARWVVAVVKNPEPVGDRPVRQLPRNAMGKNHDTINTDVAIAFYLGAIKLTTTVRLIDQPLLKTLSNGSPRHTHV